MSNCSIETCSKLILARGLCNTHYRRWQTTGDVKPDIPIGGIKRERSHKKCKIKNCLNRGVVNGIGTETFIKGYCNSHYLRLLRYGSPLSGDRPKEKHGMYGSPEYVCWNAMITRCTVKSSPSYRKYGGKGITVCDRWRYSFKNFYEDMGERPSLDHSIDRIDGTKGYYPENCRWADYHTQSINTRLQARNKAGYKGVFIRPDTGKYQAKITHYKKVIYIGDYKTLEEAISARLMAESIYW